MFLLLLWLCTASADKTKGLPNLQPLFITVDPVRDTPAVMKKYLKGQNPATLTEQEDGHMMMVVVGGKMGGWVGV